VYILKIVIASSTVTCSWYKKSKTATMALRCHFPLLFYKKTKVYSCNHFRI